MAHNKRKCLSCKSLKPVDRGVISNNGFLCSTSCMKKYRQKKSQKAATKLRAKPIKKSPIKPTVKPIKSVNPKTKALNSLQLLFNKYVRLRDINEQCISCDNPLDDLWNASHFFSQGSSSALRFNLWNCHKSCAECNTSLSGNIVAYKPRLIEKIGINKFNWLEANKSNVTVYELDWIKRAKKICKKAIAREEKRLG